MGIKGIKRDNEVNRNIDTETTEGHRVNLGIEDSDDAGKTPTARPADALDDEAEGHRLL